MNELMEAALGYVKKGWHVFPVHGRTPEGRCSCGGACDSPAKHPLTDHGFKDGTTDETTIRSWWGKWPSANIGIATGEGSNLAVVDLDGPNTQTLLKREGIFLPETATVQTGRGYHAFYAYPQCKVASKSALLNDGSGSKVDTRGSGGYVVGPPSVHITGKVYRWVIEKEDLPIFPDDVLRLLEKQDTGGNQTGTDPTWVDEALEGVSEGERDAMAARLAGYWLNVTAGNERASGQALQLWNRLNTPPMTERQVEKVLRSIAGRYTREKQHEIQTDVKYTRLDVLDGPAWADAVKDSPPREGIEAPIHTLDEVGGLVAGDLLVLAGRPGMGKSTVAWNVLADVCIRRRIPTIVFSSEMTRYDVARWVAASLERTSVAALPRQLPEHVLEQLRQSPVHMIDAGTVAIEEVETIVASNPGTRLVIVDHLTRLCTRKRHENRNLEVGQIAKGLKTIAKDKQCTVLALCQLNRTGDEHHQPKLSYLRESGDIEQEADAVIFQWTSEADLTKRFLKLAVYLAKNRHGAVKQRIVTWDRLYKSFTRYSKENVPGDEAQGGWEYIQDGAN